MGQETKEWEFANGSKITFTPNPRDNYRSHPASEAMMVAQAETERDMGIVFKDFSRLLEGHIRQQHQEVAGACGYDAIPDSAVLTLAQRRLAKKVIDAVSTDPELVGFCARAGGGKTFVWRWLEEFLRDPHNYALVEPAPPELNPYVTNAST